MSRPTEKIELGFDLTENNTGPYFRLDDPTAGALDNVNFTLGGTVFFDVSPFVKSFNTRRGKSRQLERARRRLFLTTTREFLTPSMRTRHITDRLSRVVRSG